MFNTKLHRSTLTAREVLSQNPVVLDIETTGKRDNDVVVEIAIVEMNGNILINSLVNPKRRIPKSAILKHSITNEMVTNSPSWRQIWPYVSDVIKNRMVCTYNAEYDFRLLRQSTLKSKNEWKFKRNQFFCVMTLFAYWYGEWNDYYKDYKYKKLSFAKNYCRLPGRNSHRALDDAFLASLVLNHIATHRAPRGLMSKWFSKIRD